MKNRTKEVICMLLIIIMIMPLLSPLPTKGSGVGVIAQPALNGLQILVDVLGIAGGVSTTTDVSSSACICPGILSSCISIFNSSCYTADYQARIATQTGIRDRVISELESDFQHRYSEWEYSSSLGNTLTATAGQSIFDAVEEATRIANSGGFDAVDAATKIITGGGKPPEPPPEPPNPPPLLASVIAAAGAAAGASGLANLLSVFEQTMEEGIPATPFSTTETDMSRWLGVIRPPLNELVEQQNGGYYYDFLEQRFRFFEKPDHPLLQGYCSVTGLPISAFHYGSATTTIEPGTDEWDFVTQHAVTSFTNTRGQEVTSGIVSESSQWGISYYARAYLDGEPFTGVSVPSGSTGLYFFITASNHLVRYYKTSNGTFYGSNVLTDVVSQNGLIPYYPTGSITPPQPQQPPKPQIQLAETNIINDYEALLQKINDIVSHPDRTNDEMILLIPNLTPEHFPGIPPEHFPLLVGMILEALNLEDLIVPGERAKELKELYPYIPELPTPDYAYDYNLKPPTQDPDPTQNPDTDTQGWLSNIVDKIQNSTSILQKILNAIKEIIDFLLGFIAALMKALYDMLVDLLTYLFVPPEGFIQEGFDEMRSTFTEKLPFQGFIAQIEELANLPPENVEVAYLAGLAVNENGEMEVALGGFSDTAAMPSMTATMRFLLNTIRPHLEPIRHIVVFLLFISMAHYNYKQVYFLLRRTHYTPGSTIMDRMEMK